MRLAILIPLLFPVASSTAANNICASLTKQPSVTLEIGKPVRHYRHDQSFDDLTAQAKSTGVQVRADDVVSGLTSDRRLVRVQAWSEAAQLPSGFCLTPHLKITVDQRVVTVSMPKEVPSESCFFQTTLEHEHKHAATAEDGIDALLCQEATKLYRSGRANRFPAEPWARSRRSSS